MDLLLFVSNVNNTDKRIFTTKQYKQNTIIYQQVHKMKHYKNHYKCLNIVCQIFVCMCVCVCVLLSRCMQED